MTEVCWKQETVSSAAVKNTSSETSTRKQTYSIARLPESMWCDPENMTKVLSNIVQNKRLSEENDL